LATQSAGPSFLTAEDLRALAQDPNVVVVAMPSPSDSAAGQILGSVNVFWDDTLDENRVLKSVDELKDIYAEVGVTADKRVVLFPRGGVPLTHSYTVLTLLGFDKVDFFTCKFEGWAYGAMKKADLPRKIRLPECPSRKRGAFRHPPCDLSELLLAVLLDRGYGRPIAHIVRTAPEKLWNIHD